VKIKPKQDAKSYGYVTINNGVDSVTKSAKVIAPIICEKFKPKSIIDLGCGIGDWLKVFRDNGVERVVGLDGPWVSDELFIIPKECFQRVDFYDLSPPSKKFDLAVCLEVAEHVDTAIAEKMLDYLCKSSDLVLFSAAIPGQGGHEHINERYQTYWIEKFREHGFSAFDLIRPAVWLDQRVSWWYQQNCIVFANDLAKQKHNLHEQPFITDLVHPFLYEKIRDPKNYSLKNFIHNFPHYLHRYLRIK